MTLDALKIKTEQRRKEINAHLVETFAIKVDDPDAIAHASCNWCEQDYKRAVLRFTPSCPKCDEANSLF